MMCSACGHFGGRGGGKFGFSLRGDFLARRSVLPTSTPSEHPKMRFKALFYRGVSVYMRFVFSTRVGPLRARESYIDLYLALLESLNTSGC